MGWEDRPYYREDYPGGGSGAGGGMLGGRLAGASMVVWLMGINGVVFLVDSVLSGPGRTSWLTRWGCFTVEQGVYGLQVWRWVTYQFLHANFMHILFNMISLYFFGPMMERWWGSRRFLAFYLICGLGIVPLYTLVTVASGGALGVSAGDRVVGASGCIFGVLLAAATLYPHQPVMLMFPPIPMKMRTMAFLYMGLAMLGLVSGSQNAGGDVAHLGGAAVGWFLVKRPGLLNWADRSYVPVVKNSWVQRKKRQVEDEKQQVDKILAKVRDKGLGSLTSREKKTLQRASDRMNRRE